MHILPTRYTTASSYCPLWVFPFGLLLKVFKTRLMGKGFHTLIKNASFSSPTDVGSHNPPSFGDQHPRWHSFPSPIDVGPPIHSPLGPTSLLAHRLMSTPLRGSVSSLAHHPMSGSDITCKGPSPPLVDIVLFELSLSSFPSRFLKHVC